MSDDTTDQGPLDEGPDLGAMAQASLDVPGTPATDVTGTQEPMDGTDYTVLSFTGMKYNILEKIPKIGDKLRFEVEVMVVGNGDKLMANETIRHQVICKPTLIVQIVEDEAPAGDGPPTY
jgi:hypothetical protein